MRRTPALIATVSAALTLTGVGMLTQASARPAPEIAGGAAGSTDRAADVAQARSIGASQAPRRKPTATRPVMVIGNNWDGTVTVADPVTRKAYGTLSVVPDLDDELMEIRTTPDRLAFYVAVQQGIGEGHDQLVDDVFTTNDGRYLVASRPSLADVVWIDIARAAAGRTDSIVAEQQMDGYRTDHMGVSPDGRRVLVSDSTERQVIEFSMVDETLSDGSKVTMGQRLRTFESGDTPHENNYSRDGKRIFHASIGRVYTPGDFGYVGPVDADTVSDAVKADRWVEVVRNSDFKITRRWDMGEELKEAGYPGMSSAVRPVAITPDERIMYAQVSFFHGLVEFDMTKKDPTGGGDYTLGGLPEPSVGAVTRVIDLPVSDEVKNMPREQYVLDSAQHGLAIDARGDKLCVSGTMSDYAAIVDRTTFTPKIFSGAGRFLKDRVYSKPYWATAGPGNTCWMSMSGSDLVTVISFAKEKVVAEIPVGDHPQRIRQGVVRTAALAQF